MSGAAATDPPAGGRRERAKRARRAALLAAAARALARDGAHAATVDAIAREAGTTKVVLYRYFPSREAIVREVLERFVSRVEAELAVPWRGYGSGMRMLLKAARAEPAAFRLMLDAAADPALRSYGERCRAAIVRRVLAFARGEGGAPDEDDLQTLSAHAIASLALDSLARWLGETEAEADDGTQADERFLRWYASATEALAGAWRSERDQARRGERDDGCET